MKITQIENAINQLEGIVFEEMILALISNVYYFEEGFTVCDTGKLSGRYQPSKNQVDIWFSFKKNNVTYNFLVAVTKQKNNIFTKNGKAQHDIKGLIQEAKKTSFNNVTLIFVCNQNPSIEEYSRLSQLCTDEKYSFELLGLNKITAFLQHNTNIAAKYLNIINDGSVLVPLSEYLSDCKNDSQLNKSFLFREKEKTDLLHIVSDSVKPVAIVHGPSGCGKTRLVIEVAKDLQKNNGFICYLFKPFSYDIAIKAVESLPYNKRVVLIVDDANIYHYFSFFVRQIINKPNVTILMTIRDYLWSDYSIKTDFSYFDLNLTPLKKKEIEDIVKELYGVTNQNYLEYLYAISRNNLRFALMATDVFIENQEKPKSVSDVLEKYYGAILKESEIDKNEDLEKTIVAISLLGRTDIRDVSYNGKICKLFKISNENFYHLCYEAQNKEFLSIFKNAVVEITDQVLAEYLVYKYIFLFKKISLIDVFDFLYKNHQSRIVWLFNALLGIYEYNDVIKTELTKLKDYCLNEDSREKKLVFFRLFGCFFVDECLDFAYSNIINKTSDLFNKDYYQLIMYFINKKSTYQGAVECFIKIIKNDFAIESITDFINKNFRITIETLNNRFAFEKSFVSKLIEVFKENRNVAVCLYKTIKQFFPYETSYTEYENDDKQMLFKRFIIPYSKEYAELRLLLWNGIKELIDNGYYKEVKDILNCNWVRVDQDVKMARQLDKEQSILISKELDINNRKNLHLVFSLLSLYKQSKDVKEIFDELREDKSINLFYLYVFERTSKDLYGEKLEKSFRKDYLISFNNSIELVDDLIRFYNMFFDEQPWKVGTLVSFAFKYILNKNDSNYDLLVAKFIDQCGENISFNPYDLFKGVNNKKGLLQKIVNSKYQHIDTLISQLLLTMQLNDIDDEIYNFALYFYKNRKDVSYGNDNILMLNVFESFKEGFQYEIVKELKINASNCHFIEYAFLCEQDAESIISNVFKNDIKLLKNIYFTVAKISNLCDLEGVYLRYLISKDIDYLDEYFELLFDGNLRIDFHNWFFDIDGFVDHFISYIDKAKFPSFNYLIGHTVSKMPINILTSFIDLYILKHKNNPYDLQTLSIILFQRETSDTQKILFKTLVDYEIPTGFLKMMNLFNGPHSWTGSIVPYIHRNIQEMRELLSEVVLPEQYVSYLNELINKQLERIKEEEIREFNRDER